MCQICNQCGIEYTKTNHKRGQKCDTCYDLNKAFISSDRLGYYSRETLTKRSTSIIESYRLIVDNYFKGDLVNATIPNKAKICLIKLGFYNCQVEDIKKIKPNSSAVKTESLLQNYNALYSTNINSETL